MRARGRGDVGDVDVLQLQLVPGRGRGLGLGQVRPERRTLASAGNPCAISGPRPGSTGYSAAHVRQERSTAASESTSVPSMSSRTACTFSTAPAPGWLLMRTKVRAAGSLPRRSGASVRIYPILMLVL